MKIKTALLALSLVAGVAQAEERMSQEEFSSLLATFNSIKSEAKTSVIMSLVHGGRLNDSVCELRDKVLDLSIYIDSNPSYAGAHYAYQDNIIDAALVQEIQTKYKIECE